MALTVNQNQTKFVARLQLGAHVLEVQMQAIRAEYERYALGEGSEQDLEALLQMSLSVVQATAAQWAALRTAVNF